jgi:hypothetical protein
VGGAGAGGSGSGAGAAGTAADAAATGVGAAGAADAATVAFSGGGAGGGGAGAAAAAAADAVAAAVAAEPSKAARRAGVKRKASADMEVEFIEQGALGTSAVEAASDMACAAAVALLPSRPPACVSTELPGAALDLQFCPRSDTPSLFMVTCVSGHLLFYIIQRNRGDAVGAAGANFVRIASTSLSAVEDFKLVRRSTRTVE